jgi:hypothetical protein
MKKNLEFKSDSSDDRDWFVDRKKPSHWLGRIMKWDKKLYLYPCDNMSFSKQKLQEIVDFIKIHESKK